MHNISLQKYIFFRYLHFFKKIIHKLLIFFRVVFYERAVLKLQAGAAMRTREQSSMLACPKKMYFRGLFFDHYYISCANIWVDHKHLGLRKHL
jgi:hypothetical protein